MEFKQFHEQDRQLCDTSPDIEAAPTGWKPL
jgi:hypothetical protein